MNIIFSACGISKKINKQAEKTILRDSSLVHAQTGICIFEPATGKYWYRRQDEKYFIPASNTKIFTCYAGMKYLGDSIIAARVYPGNNSLVIDPAGDPSFLHPDFERQPLYNLLKAQGSGLIMADVITGFNDEPFGRGWAWDDYDSDYVQEKSKFPVYGNRVLFSNRLLYPRGSQHDSIVDTLVQVNGQPVSVKPKFFAASVGSSYPEKGHHRSKNRNLFLLEVPLKKNTIVNLPFITDNGNTALQILANELKRTVNSTTLFPGYSPAKPPRVVYSQHTDSLLKPMMHRSDNFFAEQVLLMAAREHIGYMETAAIIDTLLKTDLAGIPQQPRWVDGSGLSRYNLFTPQSIVWVLNKMYREYSFNRIKEIFATGGEGTLSNYYQPLAGNIFAKTGTLSNHCALSGYLITRKGKLLIFSVLTSSYPGSATPVRRAVERFLTGIYERY
ncbi:MAG: D-alanyl-D-alanine carboxypeptidase [Dinghuibacter sp.]|nr:D-alanyl-D-alanine carboxypeptidase [Dinghuibacter sp.]